MTETSPVFVPRHRETHLGVQDGFRRVISTRLLDCDGGHPSPFAHRPSRTASSSNDRDDLDFRV